MEHYDLGMQEIGRYLQVTADGKGGWVPKGESQFFLEGGILWQKPDLGERSRLTSAHHLSARRVMNSVGQSP